MNTQTAPHLLVALSPHGYGHAAMTAPVVNLLRRRLPGLRVTLQTAIRRDWLATRYDEPFALIDDIADFGLCQTTATEIQVADTAAAYRRLHARLDEVVTKEAGRLRARAVDLVLSNVAYVPLLAAQQAGIPAMALSCLNWADIYRHVCGDAAEAAAIEAHMLAGYGAARSFLCPAPAMPMERLANTQPIGPVARRGKADPDGLRRMLGMAADSKLGLIAFGGFDPAFSLDRWPRQPGWRWITTVAPGSHPDLLPRSAVAMGFTDILASCDVVVTKPGYGTFTEAAVNGVPVLYVPRPDWPESPYLADWLHTHGRCLGCETAELFDDASLALLLQRLFSLPRKALVEPTGVEEGAEAILAALDGARCMRT